MSHGGPRRREWARFERLQKNLRKDQLRAERQGKKADWETEILDQVEPGQVMLTQDNFKDVMADLMKKHEGK